MIMLKRVITTPEYEAIMLRVDELMDVVDDNTPKTDRNYIELDILVDLVVDYEKEHYPTGKPKYSDTIVENSNLVFA